MERYSEGEKSGTRKSERRSGVAKGSVDKLSSSSSSLDAERESSPSYLFTSLLAHCRSRVSVDVPENHSCSASCFHGAHGYEWWLCVHKVDTRSK